MRRECNVRRDILLLVGIRCDVARRATEGRGDYNDWNMGRGLNLVAKRHLAPLSHLTSSIHKHHHHHLQLRHHFHQQHHHHLYTHPPQHITQSNHTPHTTYSSEQVHHPINTTHLPRRPSNDQIRSIHPVIHPPLLPPQSHYAHTHAHIHTLLLIPSPFTDPPCLSSQCAPR